MLCHSREFQDLCEITRADILTALVQRNSAKN